METSIDIYPLHIILLLDPGFAGKIPEFLQRVTSKGITEGRETTSTLWKDEALASFALHGHKIRMSEGFTIRVNVPEEDLEFYRMAALIPYDKQLDTQGKYNSSNIWSFVVEMLSKKRVNKKKVMDFLRPYAIVEASLEEQQ